MSKTTRKDKIERTVMRYRNVPGKWAWRELMDQLTELSTAEARAPKFRDLLVAIRRAGAKSAIINRAFNGVREKLSNDLGGGYVES